MDYNKLRTKLEDQLEMEAAKINGEMSSSQLCGIKDLLCAIQYAATIPAMDNSSDYDNGYSQSGNSYARGRSRDSMGRYSERRMGGNRYYRDDGKEHVISKLESLMNEANTDRAREAIRRAIETVEME